MRTVGLKASSFRYLLLQLLLILTCTITLMGKNPSSNSGGSSGTALTVDNIGPNSGPITGGTTVTIAGTGFQHSASVTFGGVAAPAVVYISPSKLQAITPVHASGSVSVVVTENPRHQSATLAGGFTYTDSVSISTVSPSQGPTCGGTVVSVTGTGFEAGTTVAFGGVQSTAVTFASPTQINAMSPPGSAGSVSITVAAPDAQSASVSSAFTYTSGPSVSSISPNAGPVTGGTAVDILGSGFQNGATLTFGGIAAAATFVSSVEIRAVTPASSAGTVAVAVSNPDSQTGTLGAAFTFYHIVSLAWTDGASSVAGYNVYRSSTSGGPYVKLNSSLVPETIFTDGNVQPGQVYYYVTTAVDSNNVESGYSNQAQAMVPSP